MPTHDQAKPWVARFEDIQLLNRVRYPELEPIHEITEPGHEIGAGASAAGPAPRIGTEQDPGRSENVVPSAKAEKDCCRWLKALRAAGPERPKDDYWEIARKEFERLSRRGFDRAWANAVGDDARWTRAGPKPKAPKT